MNETDSHSTRVLIVTATFPNWNGYHGIASPLICMSLTVFTISVTTEAIKHTTSCNP